ncbi:threonine-phosphate decarboxylase CobD [Fodinicurvata fenggangensis]|uniref:threonine-phosphate decarboxylase CobD n=1 Tax=Fodinicurvata fenggangensis TaxID=1121830 RepID=UPI000B0F3A45|nr:threonine-phosphate decarboxylase CobD [Fodinicurvata fenggangensis]
MSDSPTELVHGGDLDSARKRHPEAGNSWLDLSTGINPWPYPIPAMPDDAWQRLPGRQAQDELLQAARLAYDLAPEAGLTAAPGTQLLIQLLPRLFEPTNVEITGFTYGEHQRCWALAGHKVAIRAPEAPLSEAARIRIVTRPNNPDGRILPRETLMDWADRLAERDGLLVVDEAFADVIPECSLAPEANHPGLCILRSFGKFFGLAGLRLGFALGAPALQERLTVALGPWAVAGPALAIGRAALADLQWSAETRQALQRQSQHLDEVLQRAGLEILGGTSLFRLSAHDSASRIAEDLAAQGILVRSFPEEPHWLRFGLPPDEGALDRLTRALPHG